MGYPAFTTRISAIIVGSENRKNGSVKRQSNSHQSWLHVEAAYSGGLAFLPSVGPVSLMVANADHVGYSSGYWLDFIKEVVPLRIYTECRYTARNMSHY